MHDSSTVLCSLTEEGRDKTGMPKSINTGRNTAKEKTKVPIMPKITVYQEKPKRIT